LKTEEEGMLRCRSAAQHPFLHKKPIAVILSEAKDLLAV
jgi:hypothetical protein